MTRPTLGTVTLLALGVNGIVGVGIFVAPPIVARAFGGASGALVWLAVAAACVPIALAFARLARALPFDGGPYLYAERAFGRRAARAIGALVWVSAVFSTAAVTRALADLGAESFALPRAAPVIAGALVVLLAVVNARGLRLSALAWTILTVLKVAPLACLLLLAAFTSGPPAFVARTQSAPHAVGPALLAILFAFQGFEVVPLPAGQARDPETTVPRATIGALLLAAVLYAAVHLACARAIPSLAETRDAIPAAAAVLGGRTLARAVELGVVASIAGIVVGMHAMTPRYLAAIMVPIVGPAALPAREGERAGAPPLLAIVGSAALVGPFAFTSSLTQLVNLSSVAVLAQYAVTSVALAVLARRGVRGLSLRDAWPVPFALTVAAVLLAHAHAREVLVAGGVAALGATATRFVGDR